MTTAPDSTDTGGGSRTDTKIDLPRLLGFVAMVGGMFMAILDIQIVSSWIDQIRAGLSASPDEISWVQTSYLIAEVVMIPLSGFLSRLLSTRILFVISATSFTAMSVLCAFAWNIESMTVFRAFQGFLGGAMIPTTFAASFSMFRPEKRASVSVLIGLVATMAPTIGPTLGGYLTEIFSWHWLFLMNVVPGLIVIPAVWFLVDIDKPDPHLLKGFDARGLAFMATFLGCLEYVLEEGPRNDWFEDTTLLVLAIVSTVAGALFFRRVLTHTNPIVDLRAFLNRNFALGSFFSFVLGIGLYGSVYLLPLFLARVRGLNSLQIGLIMIVTGASQLISAPVAGALSKKLDLRFMLAIGLAMFGLGVYLTSFMTAEWGFWELFVPQAIRGMSLMLIFLPINTLALGTLSPEMVKNGSGLYNLMRNLGGALGLAVINTVYLDRMALHWARLSENVTTARPGAREALDRMAGLFGLDPSAGPGLQVMKLVASMVDRQAMVMSFNDTLLLMASVFGVALLLTPLVRKPGRVANGGH